VTSHGSEINNASAGYRIGVLIRFCLIAVLLLSVTLMLGRNGTRDAAVGAGALASAHAKIGGDSAGADSVSVVDIADDAAPGSVMGVIIEPNATDIITAQDGADIKAASGGGAAYETVTFDKLMSDLAEAGIPMPGNIRRRDETAADTPSFPAIQTFCTELSGFSAGVALAHQAQLDRRSDAIAYARQIASAKHLSQSAYKIDSFAREAFIHEHGMSAAELTEKDISEKYDNDYFLERLEEMGFFRNDNYGRDVNRRNAIIRAQSAFNIPITAKIDLNTKRALIAGTDFVPRDTITGAHPDGMWVVIDKSARILTVYIDDVVFNKYPVAVGRNVALTPEGQFTFVSKAKNPRWGGGGYAAPVAGGAPNNPLGKRWIGISKGGGGQYGVHGNVSAYSIGTNASAGCVRMINADVEEMYEYITIGTPVWIGTTAKLAEWGIYQQLGSWTPVLPSYLDYLPQTLLYEE